MDAADILIRINQTAQYVRLNALALASTGPLYPNTIREHAAKFLAEASRAADQTLVVDCFGVDHIENLAFEAVRAAVTARQAAMSFFRMKPSVEREIIHQLGASNITWMAQTVKGPFLTCNAGPTDEASAMLVVDAAAHAEREHLGRILADSYVQTEDGVSKRMSSTPLQTLGEFDARRVLSYPARYLQSTAALAEALEIVVQQCADRGAFAEAGPRIIAVSLRGSAIATGVAVMTGRQSTLEIVDHIGPRQKVLEEHSLDRSREGGEYIYVGDYLVGGTEIKVAQAYLRSRGATLRGAVALGSLLAPSEYGFEFPVASLVELQRVRTDLRYSLQ